MVKSWLLQAFVGALVWGSFWIFDQPQPRDVMWAMWLLMLAPLVLVPMGLRLRELWVVGDQPSRIKSLIQAAQFPAAILLAAAQPMDQGWQAAAVSTPWLLVTTLCAAEGIHDGWNRRKRGIDRFCVNAGLVYLAIGGSWAVIDRSGWRPLEFEPVIVMLTAIHFHFAGFVLPLVTGLTARHVGGRVMVGACVAVVVGMPLVAFGITGVKIGLPAAIESFAAVWMSLAGALTAIGLFRASRMRGTPQIVQVFWIVASAALVGGMALSAMYGLRHFLAIAWLDIPLMRITHGTANAIGFALCAVIGWTLVPSSSTRQAESVKMSDVREIRLESVTMRITKTAV